MDDDQNVCSFCGMSHLMYSEMKKKERRIAELEKQLGQGGKPVAGDVSAAHYAQLQQVQASVAQRTEAIEQQLAESEAKRAAAEQQVEELKAQLAEAHRASGAAREQLQAERAERDGVEAARQLDQRGAESTQRDLEAARELALQRLTLLRAVEQDRDQQHRAAAAARRRERVALTRSLEATLALRRELDAVRRATAATIAEAVRQASTELREGVGGPVADALAAAGRAASDAAARQRALEAQLASGEQRLAESAAALEAAASAGARERAERLREAKLAESAVQPG